MLRRKILFLLESLARGGVQQGVLQKAPRMDSSRFDVRVWALRKGKKQREMEEEFLREGVKVEFIRTRGLGDTQGIFNLAKKLREEKIELLNTRSFYANMIGRMAARLAGVPVVIANYHHTYDHRWNAKYLAHERMLRAGTDRFVSVSQAVHDYLAPRIGWPEEKARVVYNGLNLKAFDLPMTKAEARRALNMPEGIPIVANIGRLTKVKDLPTFIQAVPKIVAACPETLFLVVGEGEERDELQRLAAPHGDRIRFLGSRNDIPAILRAADVLALSSLLEGLPRIVMEAFAARTPVVSTPAGGVEELLKNGSSGWIVPFSDPTKLAEGVIEAISNPEVAARFVEAAHREIQAYTLEGWVRRTEELFSEAMDEKREALREWSETTPEISKFRMMYSHAGYRLGMRKVMLLGK